MLEEFFEEAVSIHMLVLNAVSEFFFDQFMFDFGELQVVHLHSQFAQVHVVAVASLVL